MAEVDISGLTREQQDGVQADRASFALNEDDLMCVSKKDRTLRLCVDYSELNRRTVPDRHPLPGIQEALDSLGGHWWFSIPNQRKAYHQDL